MMNPFVSYEDFLRKDEDEQRAWVQCMFDHGANGSVLAGLFGISPQTMNWRLRKLGFRRNQGRKTDIAYDKWNDFLNCYPDYDPHAEPNYDKVNEEYELSDADFEGFASNVVDKGDPVITTENDIVPTMGSYVFYGTAAQVAEAFYKRVPTGKMRVIITWDTTDALN